MSTGPTIREYQDSDEAAVIQLVRELQAFEMPINPYLKQPAEIGQAYIAEIMRWCAESDGVVLVAEGPEGLTGYACLLADCKAEGKDSEFAYNYALVADLVVTERLRRRGIGTALLAECERRARLKGRDILRIGVMAMNPAAHSAYHKFGFTDRHYKLEKRLT